MTVKTLEDYGRRRMDTEAISTFLRRQGVGLLEIQDRVGYKYADLQPGFESSP